MKGKLISSLLIAFMSLNSFKLYAYDIAVENADGVTIYYNYINDGKELEVTYRWNSYSSYDKSYSGSVIIPEEVTYMNRTRKVTSIGKEAFEGCNGLTSVTFPNSVTNIGDQSFNQCFGLTSVTIPNSVTSIGGGAFQNCNGLTSVNITDIESWCKITFSSYGCNPLEYAHHLYMDGNEITDLVIPNSVTSIGEYTFCGCYGLTSVTIGNSVTSIGNYAFYGCHGLTSVTIGNSVTSIGNDAFWYCSGLTSVTIPNSVTSIGNRAFEGCSGLTSVTIGNSVTSIGSSAFSRCSGLTSVTIGNSVTSIGGDAFNFDNLTTVVSLIENPFKIEGKGSNYSVFSLNTIYNATLYVPKGTIDKYKSTEGWKEFVWIEEGAPSSISNLKHEESTINRYYNLDGIESSQSRNGINIIKMNDGTVKKVMVK